MLNMEDLDESYFEIKETEISLDKEYFDKALDLLMSNRDATIKDNEVSGISYWDLTSPIQDAINHANYGWVESDGMFDDIDFSSDHLNMSAQAPGFIHGDSAPFYFARERKSLKRDFIV